jgi:hypothetical protein
VLTGPGGVMLNAATGFADHDGHLICWGDAILNHDLGPFTVIGWSVTGLTLQTEHSPPFKLTSMGSCYVHSPRCRTSKLPIRIGATVRGEAAKDHTLDGVWKMSPDGVLHAHSKNSLLLEFPRTHSWRLTGTLPELVPEPDPDAVLEALRRVDLRWPTC